MLPASLSLVRVVIPCTSSYDRGAVQNQSRAAMISWGKLRGALPCASSCPTLGVIPDARAGIDRSEVRYSGEPATMYDARGNSDVPYGQA
jgi:hypothetical protein